MLLSTRRLYLLFTPALCRGEPWSTLAAALRGGVDVVQWRVPGGGDREDFERCRGMCRDAGVPLVVNDDVMLAVYSHAAGAHVGQDDMPADAARRLLGAQWLGVSTHDVPQVRAAIAAGADYLGFGPCFATATKGYEVGKGMDEIAAAVAAAAAGAGPVPVFAIGGITAARVPELRAVGVRGVAVSSAVLAAKDPEFSAAALRDVLEP